MLQSCGSLKNGVIKFYVDPGLGCKCVFAVLGGFRKLWVTFRGLEMDEGMDGT